ncbi:MAG TPA: DUF892 family protein [Chthonomonadaceae bacterium]|nr:DUF892 family protein [Chthonomonadaceae bacterium]
MAEDVRDKLIRYLDDAWAVEKSLVSALKDMADNTNDAAVRALYEQHSRETHDQEERLEARIRALGAEPSGSKGLLNSLMAKISEMLNTFHSEADRTTQDLVKAFAIENFEQAMYQALMAYAQAIGDNETVSLANQLMQEERQAADKVWAQIAPAATRPLQEARPPAGVGVS